MIYTVQLLFVTLSSLCYFFKHTFHAVNLLPNNKINDWATLKIFAGNNLKVAGLISVFDRIANIVRKGENADHQHFLLFPQCFQKASSIELLKVVTACDKG